MSIQVNNKNLGHATAYAYAVAGGYTGTEAEFIELLGNIADDLEQIENLTVTVETLAAGSSATASYSTGVLHLGIPKGDKGDKGDTGATGPTGPTGNGIASVAKTGTSGLVDTYTITYTNGNTSTFTVTNGAEAVDDTLTIAGRAADAKKTGDEISELKEDLSQIEERTNNLFDTSDYEDILAFDLTGTVQAATGAKSVIIPVNVTTETSVTAHRATIASRFALSAYTAKPVVGATSKYHDYNNSASSITITVDSTIKYLMVYLWRPDDSPITMEQMTDGLMVQFGSAYTGYEPYYVPKIADRQIASEKLSNDVNEQLTSGEIQDIIFDSSFNLWTTSLLEVMENTRCSGYNTTTCEITTAVADNYATAIMDIPQNINKLKIQKIQLLVILF